MKELNRREAKQIIREAIRDIIIMDGYNYYKKELEKGLLENAKNLNKEECNNLLNEEELKAIIKNEINKNHVCYKDDQPI